MNSPVKKIHITQIFGANPQIYSQFGLKGHNGIDYRAFLPNGERCYEGGKSEVFAPHDGKIIENRLDNGYGWYIKIENEKEGSILAHFSHQSPKKVGDTVKTGEFVGFQGTTGFSTGIHLHWGYYLHPRNRSNGYAGYINQEGLYKPYGVNMSCLINNDDAGKKLFEELVNKSSRYDAFNRMGYETAEAVKILLEDLRRNIDGLRKERDTARAELEQRRKEHQAFVAKLALNLNTRQDEPEIISKTEMFGRIDEELEDLRVKYAEDRQAFALTEAELRAEIARLKALQAHENVLENAEARQLVSEIIKRLFRALDFVKK